MQHLWKDSDKATETSLLSVALIHHGLVVLEDCKAILRRDYSNMIDKVKLISGGGSGNEPAYGGFVGPGMLTAAIYGNISSAPPVNSILRVIEEIGTDYSPGVLLIVPNYSGHRINFGIAKLRAESMGIYVKMVIVGDDVCIENDYTGIEKRGLAGILFINKIAGAMAENGENLESINNVCNRIINNGEIATISIGMKLSFSYEENLCSRNDSFTKIKIGYGVHGEVGVFTINKTSIEDVTTLLMNKLILLSQSSEEKKNSIRRFPVGHNVAVMVNNLGASNQIECNVFTVEVLKQLKDFDLLVQRIYTGHLMTSLDSYGFQVSLLNLSIDPDLIKYLDSPTSAPAWPKVLTAEMVGFEQSHDLKPSIPTKYCRDYCNGSLPHVKPQGTMLDNRSGQVLLICISFACEALIVCAEQLNTMDKESGDGDCGTTLARGANAIKNAIKESKLNSTNLFVIFTQISCIIEKEMGGLQGGLYSLFFHAVAKTFGETVDQITSRTWLNALIAGNKVISEFGKVSFGDRTMLDPLMAAQNVLSSTLDAKMHPIQAFGEAVKAAEQCAIQTLYTRALRGRASLLKSKTFKYPDPGAHAIGIWMRASYEGVKLKLICQCEL
ncbi:PREDICTED: triokinase/FMN cyclase-like isoform X1 [Polistes canadensis]|uniref:triokinase/FMN cyclase-like isoform X1 n=2 Tax=Polistes canadensis TaxID=91411 RepID=UPI000718AEAE|nr:PREDICTED: triokinase/FMN cyclase-like isoform X1 [Polistes canadensis]